MSGRLGRKEASSQAPHGAGEENRNLRMFSRQSSRSRKAVMPSHTTRLRFARLGEVAKSRTSTSTASSLALCACGPGQSETICHGLIRPHRTLHDKLGLHEGALRPIRRATRWVSTWPVSRQSSALARLYLLCFAVQEARLERQPEGLCSAL